jgi:hypothetical protein
LSGWWPYKLKLSKNVKRHLERVFWDAGWTDAGHGWEGTDGALPSVRLGKELARHSFNGLSRGRLRE